MDLLFGSPRDLGKYSGSLAKTPQRLHSVFSKVPVAARGWNLVKGSGPLDRQWLSPRGGLLSLVWDIG